MNKEKILAGITAGMVALAAFAGSVTPVAAGNEYEPVSGGTMQFEKYLVFDKQANCPTAEFSFTIADGTAIPANKSAHKAAIYAGNSDESVSNTAPAMYDAATNTANKAVFTNAKPVYESAQPTLNTLGQKTTLTTDPVDLQNGTKAYSRAEVTVDFTGVTFSEPGVYRWVISETALSSAQTDAGFTADTNSDRILDVYVADTGTQDSTTHKWGLAITGYVLHDSATFQPTDQAGAGVTPTEPDVSENHTKAIGFTNTFDTNDLTFSNTITGNQASHDKYFKYTLTLGNAGDSTKLWVDITNADASTGQGNGATLDDYNNKTNPNSFEEDSTTHKRYVVTGSDGSLTKDFYLQYGQSIVVKGIPNNASYSIVEVAEDYTPSVTVTGDTINGKTGSTAVAGVESAGTSSTTYTVADSALTADTTLAFSNARLGTIPTGVITSVLPGVMILVIAGIGVVMFARKKAED